MAMDGSALPEKISAAIARNNACVLTALSKTGEVAALAVFESSQEHREEVHLLHLYVNPLHRNQGAAQNLIDYAERYYYQRGALRFRVKCCGSAENLAHVYDFLLSEAFVPLAVDGHLMHYRLSDWLHSSFADMVRLHAQQLKQVERFATWDDPFLQSELRKSPALALSEHCFDPEFCRFYVVDDHIKAILCAERTAENLLYFNNLFFTDDCPRQAAFISMLSSFLLDAANTVPEMTDLVVESHLSSVYRGLLQQFDAPSANLLIHEYIYHFGNRGEVGLPDDYEKDRWDFTDTLPAAVNGIVDLSDLLSPADELNDPMLQTQLRPSALIPGILARGRQTLSDVEEDVAWRAELNAWRELLGRSPFSSSRPLPFAALVKPRLQRLKPPAEHAAPPSERLLQATPATSDCFVFPEKSELLVSVLPSYLHERYLDGDLIVIGCRDRSEFLTAYGVFSPQTLPEKTVMLEYLYVSDHLRRKGFGTALLSYARTVFSESGMRGIITQHIGTPQQLVETHLFFKQINFMPVTISSLVSIYYIQELYDMPFLNMPESRLAALPGVESFSGRDDPRLRQFAQLCRQHSFIFEKKRFDPRLTRCYTKGGAILSAMCIEQTGERVFTLRDICFNPAGGTSVARASLLANTLREAKNLLREDSILVLQLDRGWNHDTIRSLLGVSEADLYLNEYVMPF